MAGASQPPDAAMLQESIAVLQPLVSQVPIDEKHLARPPFRYLVDLVREVFETTGFGRGLFSDAEFSAENYKASFRLDDKESKVAFLSRLIALVELALPEAQVALNPKKVVAGLDADATNAFLQVLGRAAAARVSTEAAVQRLTGSARAPEALTARPASSARRPPSAGRRPPSATALAAEPAEQAETPGPEPLPRSVVPEGSPMSRRPASARPGTARRPPPPQLQSPVIPADDRAPVAAGVPLRHDLADLPSEPVASAAVGRNALVPATVEPAIAPVTVQRPPRAGSAFGERRRPPSAVQRTPVPNAEESRPAARPSSTRRAAEDDEFAVTFTAAAADGSTFAGWLDAGGEAGAQELEAKQAETTHGVAAAAKEADAFRDAVQTLCAAVSPLATTLEYLHADFDAMGAELRHWEQENGRLAKQLKAETEALAHGQNPIHQQLRHVEAGIERELERILACKAAILKNDAAIHRLCEAVLQPVRSESS